MSGFDILSVSGKSATWSRLATFLVTGVIAGSALLLSTASGFAPWVLFLAWVAYAFAGTGLSSVVSLLCAFIGGCFVGLLVTTSGEYAEPYLGPMALPLTLGLMCGALALLSYSPVLNCVPAWFTGMVAYFAAGGAAGPPIDELVLPAAMGMFSGWLAQLLLALARLVAGRGLQQ